MFDYREKFDTLYGVYSPEEKVKNTENDFYPENYVPWHVGWRTHRNTWQDQSGEYNSSDNWSAEKIMRPSYSLYTVFKLKLHICGKRARGKLRAHTFSVRLELGNNYRYGKSFPLQNCKSVTDACRKAEKIPDIDSSIESLLKIAYSQQEAKAVFKKIDNEYVPFFSAYDFCWNSIDFGIDYGEFIVLYWDKGYCGDKQVKLVALEVHKTGICSSSGGVTKQNKEIAEKLECWIENIEEEIQ